MKVRQAKKEDLPTIEALIRMFPEQLVQDELPRYKNFFVAVEGGEVAGCCALEIYSKKIAEVRSLAVRPEYQKRGIATRLVKRCLKKARVAGIREVLAITGALKFFERQGFKTFHKEKYALLKVL